MNAAFALSKSRDDAAVMFSTGLLEQMDADAVAAVATHEVAHIAHGDCPRKMLLLACAYGIGVPVILILLVMGAMMQSDEDWYMSTVMAWFTRVYVGVLIIASTLSMLRFSRAREFDADRLAAQLVSRDAMIKPARICRSCSL